MTIHGMELSGLAWHRPVIWLGIVSATWQLCGTAIGVAVLLSSITSYLFAVHHMMNPWRPEE